MKVKIAPNDTQSMSQDGSAILRSLQNKNLKTVDLMVRESLQNSLDATLEGAPVTDVEFKIGSFNSESLALNFEMITEKLIEKFSVDPLFLSIRDKNTSGLTGDYKSNSQKILDSSNFQKLVFGIGKNQNQEGAGGSWGLGKTSYFRIGEGIVLYYTRIAVSGGYEERLIASLIEDPKRDDRIFDESERGIAWWGEFDSNENKLYPLTNHDEIKKILNIFGIENYKNSETGTTIIVPYLKDMEENSKEFEDDCYPWEFEYEEAIIMAVQRWYSPRIWNEKYSVELGNSQLHCTVNGVGIHPEVNMEPTFKLFRDLYTSALLGLPESPDIKVEKIILPRNAMKIPDEPIGYIAFCEVSRDLLRMNEPDNKKSGLAYIGVTDKGKIDRNVSKVIAYSRKPGMVVEYSVDGEWAPTGLIQKEDNLLFGFFVPNSKGELLEKFQELGYSNVEQYLRATESADHANWIDDAGIGIIRRIKSYTSKAIGDFFQTTSENDRTTATSALSRKFGALLMPPKNFGKTSAKKSVSDSAKRNVESRDRISDIKVIETTQIDKENMEIIFKAYIKKESKSMIFIQVLTQEQKMDKADWDKVMGYVVEFPIKMERVHLKKIDGEDIDQFSKKYTSSDLEFKFSQNDMDGIEIISNIPTEIEVEGSIHIRILSNEYLPNVAIRSNLKMNEGEN